jgi:PilZ domain-containing protein
MYASKAKQTQRPRELRRRVMIPARLHDGVQWNDARILNISSRGLLVHCPRPVSHESVVELRRGDHVIVARVVWREGTRAGLRVDDRLPVEQIMSQSQSQSLQITAPPDAFVEERRKQSRAVAADARLRGRAMEFVSIGVIGTSLAVAVWSMVQHALVGPLAAISSALGQ